MTESELETQRLIGRRLEAELPDLPPRLRTWVEAHLTPPRPVIVSLDPARPEDQTLIVWLVTDDVGAQDSDSRLVFDLQSQSFGVCLRLAGGVEWYLHASPTLADAVGGM
jgi:hypothetical protein